MEWKLKNILSTMESTNVDVLVVTQPSNVTYITGFLRSSGTVLLLAKSGEVTMLVPALDYWRAFDTVKLSGLSVVPYATYQLPDIGMDIVEPPHTHIPKILKERGITRVAVDNPYTRISLEIGKALGIEVVDLSDAIADLRAVKQQEEVELMKRALAITEEALERALTKLEPGVSENAVAAAVEYYMRQGGADGLAFETIVAFGENSSYPHATVTGKTLRETDVVVIDMGAQIRGYSSDLTRTITIGRAEGNIKKLVEVVSEAIDEAVDLVHDGVVAEDVDSRARNVVRRAGFGKYFIHSLGHGVGIEVHEKPRIAQGSKEVLREGMIVTIEPGIYLPGKYGVRIENMVLVKKTGSEILNKLDKVLTTIS